MTEKKSRNKIVFEIIQERYPEIPKNYSKKIHAAIKNELLRL